MATRILGPTGSRRRRRFLFVPILSVTLVAFFMIAGAQANPPQNSGNFELDRNAKNDVSTTFLGSLGGNINATVTSFTVCQAVNANPAPLPITIQVDAEQMTVGAIQDAGGGGCSGAFKKTYSSVTRGVNSTTAASHGASGVSGFVTRVVTGAVVGDDWDQVFAAVDANGHPTPTEPNPCSGAAWTASADITACDWEHDPDGETIFSTGSKDYFDIPAWEHSDGSVPDADDITDAFVAKYVDSTDGHEYLFFGADRTAVNGAKDMGFWFFKSPVSLNEDGTFSGTHTVGDILLLSTFTQGGALTTIRVFSWAGPGNGDTNDTLDSGGEFGDCITGLNTNGGCATVNNSTVQSPWTYQSKISGSPADTLYAGALLEGGVDLTTLGLQGCFSNFLAETRSSPEVTATLKDFVLGSFEVCQPTLTTQQSATGPVTPGTAVTDTATVQVTGSTNPADAAGTVRFDLCGPIPDTMPPTFCTTGGSQVGTTSVPLSNTACDPDSPSNTDGKSCAVSVTVNDITQPAGFPRGPLQPGRYCFRATATLTNYDSPAPFSDDPNECFTVVKLPTMTVTTPSSGSITLGSTITDTAVVTGSAAGGDPTGTVSFFVCGPFDAPALCDGTTGNEGTAVTGNPVTCVPDGTTPPNDTTYTCSATSGSFEPPTVGRYCFRAEYSGNTVYNGSSDSRANECFTVTNTSSGTSAQNWLPNDRVVVSTPSGTVPGTLSIRLFKDSCDPTVGTLVYTEPVPNSGAFTATVAGAIYDTTNGNVPATTFRVINSNEGTYFWRIVFTPDNPLNGPGFTACENTVLTITD